MAKMVVERRDSRNEKATETCYIVVKQAWSGLIRDACSYCDVTIPAEATHCPTCGRLVTNR